MIKVDMSAPELDQQIELLKVYPEILEKHFRPALYQSVNGLASRIRPLIPVKTGEAVRTFGSKVTGKGVNLTGRVGWYDKKDPIYPNIIEYGAKPHPLNKGVSIRQSNKKTALFNKARESGSIQGSGTHVLIGDHWVTMQYHPGFSAVGFMAAGYSAYKPAIEAALERANEGVVKDLALND